MRSVLHSVCLRILLRYYDLIGLLVTLLLYLDSYILCTKYLSLGNHKTSRVCILDLNISLAFEPR